jgi:arylsulfatase A-like enzyme
MNTPRIFRSLIVLLSPLAFLALTACSSKQDPGKPNIILIYADDLGYGDPGCYGGQDIQTPNIDRLAGEGVRFTDAHVTCAVCGPSRVGLLTGIYQQRTGCYWNRDLWFQYGWQVPVDVKLIPEVLKSAGYATGHVGKWNITEFPQDYFDEAYDVMIWKGAYYPDGQGHYQGVNEGDFNPEPHGWGPPREGTEYLTDRLTRHAVDFIERHQSEPFFLYLAYNAPHTPAQADRKYDEVYSHLEPEPYRIYAGMVSSLDENIGKVMAKLEESGLSGKTLVVFTSDNGPARGASYIKGWPEEWPATLMGSAGPLNGHKATRYEGGHREPFIIKWPEKLDGGKVFGGLTSTMDIFPTLVNAAGAEYPEGQTRDGVDLMPYLTDRKDGAPHDTLYWLTHNQGAVRAGDWKLLVFPGGRTELYNLAEDLGETRDLGPDHPDLVRELLEKLYRWSRDFPEPVCEYEKVDLSDYLSTLSPVAKRLRYP